MSSQEFPGPEVVKTFSNSPVEGDVTMLLSNGAEVTFTTKDGVLTTEVYTSEGLEVTDLREIADLTGH